MATSRSLPEVVTLADPRPGTVVGLAPGSRLHLQFRSGLGRGRWHLAAHPVNLLPLVREESEVSFLVFEGAPATLRLERRRARSDVGPRGVRAADRSRRGEELAKAGRRSA